MDSDLRRARGMYNFTSRNLEYFDDFKDIYMVGIQLMQPFWNTSVFHEVLQAYKKRVDLSLKNKIISWISERKYRR